MPGVFLAWLAGETIIIYRSWKQDHKPPMPGQLLASTALFAALGLLAQNQQTRFLAGALAWGFDVAAFMNLAPALTGNTGEAAKKDSKTPAKKGATA